MASRATVRWGKVGLALGLIFGLSLSGCTNPNLVSSTVVESPTGSASRGDKTSGTVNSERQLARLIGDVTTPDACRAHFADTAAARSTGELVCSNWAQLARYGKLQLQVGQSVGQGVGQGVGESVGQGGGENLMILTTQLVDEPEAVTEKFRIKQDQSGKITELLAPETLWATQALNVTKTGADLLLGANPEWVSAWERARTVLAKDWAKDRLTRGVVVEFPQQVSVFLSRTKMTQSFDTGAVAVPFGATSRIVVNPVVAEVDQESAAALLAHELTHLAWEKCRHEPLWIEEGFAEWRAWQLRPQAKAEAISRVGADVSLPETEEFDDPKTTRSAYDRAGLAVTRIIEKDGLAAFVKTNCQ